MFAHLSLLVKMFAPLRMYDWSEDIIGLEVAHGIYIYVYTGEKVLIGASVVVSSNATGYMRVRVAQVFQSA